MVQKDKTVDNPQTENEASPSPASVEACVDALGPVDGPVIGVERTGRRKFTSGVVEGEQMKMVYALVFSTWNKMQLLSSI